MTTFDPAQRRSLRDALIARYPWIDHHEVGPRAVEAGECDRCGAEARMVMTCGPIRWAGLGRACAAELGMQAWCDGHADDARTWLGLLAALPREADAVARLWWVATGEVRISAADVVPLLREALPGRERGNGRSPGTDGTEGDGR